jgi:hypothetical protein
MIRVRRSCTRKPIIARNLKALALDSYSLKVKAAAAAFQDAIWDALAASRARPTLYPELR